MTAEVTGLCVPIVEDEPIIALDVTSIVQDAGAVVLGGHGACRRHAFSPNPRRPMS